MRNKILEELFNLGEKEGAVDKNPIDDLEKEYKKEELLCKLSS